MLPNSIDHVAVVVTHRHYVDARDSIQRPPVLHVPVVHSIGADGAAEETVRVEFSWFISCVSDLLVQSSGCCFDFFQANLSFERSCSNPIVCPLGEVTMIGARYAGYTDFQRAGNETKLSVRPR